MAQLKSTVVSGSLRVTDSTYTSTLQTQILHAPTASNGTSYGAGTDGQILRTNGASAYWGDAPASGVTSITLTSGAGITVSNSGTAITSTGSRTISITGVDTSNGSESQCLTKKGTWKNFTANAGTVTSVQVQASSPLQSSTSTAQNTSLNTTISFSNQNANLILAGPSTGSAAAPTFRSLVLADIPSGIARGNGRVFYGTCDTAAATADKVVTCASYDTLTVGDIIVVKFDNTNDYSTSLANLTLKVNTTNKKNIRKLYNYTIGNLNDKRELNKDTLGIFMYSGTYWILINSDVNSTYYNTSVYCGTAAATAAKAGTVSYHTAATAGKYFQVMMIYDNSVQGALTFSVGGSGNKPLYINGTVSSSTNHTLPRGLYFVYYDGTNFYFRTDDKITGNITGTAANVTGTVTIGHGGTGTTTAPTQGGVIYASSNSAYASTGAGTAGQVLISGGSNAPAWYGGFTLTGSAAASYVASFAGTTAATSTTTGAVKIAGGLGVAGSVYGTSVYGAVWNDYAEYRQAQDQVKPGNVVIDTDWGTLRLSTKRLQPGAQVVSDTFGFAIGKTDECETPLAVSGRVLAYTYQPRENYHAGMAVCSAPNGTIDIMTREEIQKYPDAIIGIVSEIPNYESWGTGNVPINGRIWIKVR